MTGLNLLKAVFAALLLLFTPVGFGAQEPAEVTQQSLQVDINSADAATIAQVLDGIGMVKAKEIVAYREMFGNFAAIEELSEVQGIGSATVERNRDRILIVVE